MDEHKITKKTIPIHTYPSRKPATENAARANEMIQPKMRVAI
jgi:hypothetical protein